MKTIHKQKAELRHKRAIRVRKKLRGNAIKPRLCVVKTNMHIEVQLIDDEKGATLAATSTQDKEFKNSEFNRKNKASAKKLGEKIAEKAAALNVKEAIFDRGYHKFHGILAELANAARGCGLKC